MKHILATKSFLSSFFCTYFFFFKKVLNMSCTLNASLLWPLFWPWANLMLVIWRLIFWGEFCMTKATVEFRLDPILNHKKKLKYKCKNWGKENIPLKFIANWWILKVLILRYSTNLIIFKKIRPNIFIYF